MKYLNYLFLAFLLLWAMSCSKSEPATIELSEQSIVIANDNSDYQFKVVSNVDWVISVANNVSGVRITPMQGKSGETTVSILATPNMTEKERNIDVTVTGGGVSKKVQLSQNAVVFSISAEELSFKQVADEQTISLKSNTKWTIESKNLPKWIESVTPSTGDGDATITIKTKINEERRAQEFPLQLSYAKVKKNISLKKESAYNDPPSKPEITEYSKTGKNGITLVPVVKWSKSTDKEGDVMQYTVCYSTDGKEWKSLPETENTEIDFIKSGNVLDPNKKYFIKVKADDTYNEGIVYSDSVEIVTGDRDCYAHGTYKVYQTGKVSNPVKLVFTGDGYLSEHYKYEGKFDQEAKEAIDGLFSVEPYKTYKDYFTVYTIAAFSKEEGVSVNDSKKERVSKDTYFKCTLVGGTGIECLYEKVNNLACLIDGFTEDDLKKTSISVMINANEYAGTCYVINDGSSIAMSPVVRKNNNFQTQFVNVVLHEFGGHGFGRLGDEYRNLDARIPDDLLEELNTWQEWGYSKNLSSKSNIKDSPWAQFDGKEKYKGSVDMFAGGYYYSSGVYRPEFVSCMEDNRNYYNAQSRYLIYERIMQVTGNVYSFEEFLKKDVHNPPAVSQTKSSNEDFIPLGKPIMVIKK